MTRAELEELDALVVARLGRAKAADWWVTENPMLGDLTPSEFASVNPRKLERFVRFAWSEHGSHG